jgi:hypothetical protein
MDLPLVIRDRDTLAFALEQAGLTDDAVRSVDNQGFLSTELELRSHGRIVYNVRELVSRLQLKDVHRAHVTTMSATGALLHLDDDLNHVRPPER